MDTFNHGVDGDHHAELDKESLANEFDVGHELVMYNMYPPLLFMTFYDLGLDNVRNSRFVGATPCPSC